MTTGEARKAETLAEAAKRRERRFISMIYIFAVGFIGMLLGLVIAYGYISQTGRESRKAVCSVIHANQEVYRETPPTTDVGRNAARSWDDLAVALNC